MLLMVMERPVLLRLKNVSKITINNLTFKNCIQSPIDVYENSTLILINVTFINNKDGSSGGAIYVDDSFLTVNNCSFSENYAKYGAAINSRYSAVTINKSEFRNNNPMEWSLIYASEGSTVNIND
ncbi:right-handed parallel beta-helix repeat-containing protein, partial [Methanobrevibacter sp.]